MAFGIVWAPVEMPSPLADALGATTALWLPHLVDDPSPDKPATQFSATLDAKTLSLGILMTTDEGSRYVVLTPTRPQLRTALRLLAQDLHLASEDELCGNGAAYLRENYGSDAGLIALRRAVELLPNSVLCRGDLVVGLFTRATVNAENARADLEEAAAVFLAWQLESTSRCANEEVVFYCGIAALTYLARVAERDQLTISHRSLLARYPWLTSQISRLDKARPAQLADIALAK